MRRLLQEQLQNKAIDCSRAIYFGREYKTSFKAILNRRTKDGPNVTRKQFPILAAAAKTGHKAQSETHKVVLANLQTNSHDHGAYYTILSRVTSRHGLKLFNVNWDVIDDIKRIDPRVDEEMKRLENFRVQVCQPQLQERPGIHLIYHNISSLTGQWQELIDVDPKTGDVRSKYENLLDAQVLIFAEAHLTQHKIDQISHQRELAYQLPGFQRLPLPTNPNNNLYGIVCYYKDSQVGISEFNRIVPNPMDYPLQPAFKNTGQVEVVSFLLEIEHFKWLIVAVYKAPRLSLDILLDQLELVFHYYRQQREAIQDRLLIIGDFNVRMNADEEANKGEFGEARQLQDWMEKKEFFQLEIGPGGTTDQGTEIDLAWAQLPCSTLIHQRPRPEAATMDSYYSYHKMLLATFPPSAMTDDGDVEMPSD